MSCEIFMSDNKHLSCDLNDKLLLYHFSTCDNNSNEEVKNMRGIIVDYCGKLICKTFSFTPEYSPEQYDELEKILSPCDKCKFFLSKEGTTLRLYYYNNKWHLSTHRKLDAFKSYWGSNKSFGELFEKTINTQLELTLEEFYNSLDKDYIYAFLLTNNSENRVVCYSSLSSIFCVGIFKMKDNNTILLDTNDYVKITGISTPKQLQFESVRALCDFVKYISYYSNPGVVVYLPNDNLIKVINSTYSSLYKIRGNQPNLKFRYLQIRNDNEVKEKFLFLYSDFENLFKDVENKIFSLATLIFEVYKIRYIHKHFLVVPGNQHYILKLCHHWHLQDRVTNKITLKKVLEIINLLPANNLFQLT